MPDMPTIARSNPLPPAPPPPRLATAADLDRLWHNWQSRFTGGRSPSTVSLAVLDWAAHAGNAPIIVTSRADSTTTRLASCALGVLVARANLLVPGEVA